MNYATRLCVVLAVLFAGCNDEEPGNPEKEQPEQEQPEKLECSQPGFVAATICCYDPDDDEEGECSMNCQPTCDGDEDCSEGEYCQQGVCGPDGDCSL